MPRGSEDELIDGLRDHISKLGCILKDYIEAYCEDKGIEDISPYFLHPETQEAFLIRRSIISRVQGRDRVSSARPLLYAPQPDIAFGPFNLCKHTSQHMQGLCSHLEEQQPISSFLDKLREANQYNVTTYMAGINNYDRKLLMNIRPISDNPRCFIEIEVSHSGSRKHVLGSLINSSILGYYGVLVAEDPSESNEDTRRKKRRRRRIDVRTAIRIKYFLMKTIQVKDIMRGKVLGENVFIVSRSQFENILKQVVEKD